MPFHGAGPVAIQTFVTAVFHTRVIRLEKCYRTRVMDGGRGAGSIPRAVRCWGGRAGGWDEVGWDGMGWGGVGWEPLLRGDRAAPGHPSAKRPPGLRVSVHLLET